MDEKIDKAIEVILAHVSKPGSPPKPDDTQKLTQSVLNLAHAKQILLGKAK